MEVQIEGKGIYPLLSLQDMLNALRIGVFPLPKSESLQSSGQIGKLTHKKKKKKKMILDGWLLANKISQNAEDCVRFDPENKK